MATKVLAATALMASVASGYHTSGNWTRLANNPHKGHSWHSVSGAGGELWVAGGSDNVVMKYDTSYKTWSAHPDKFPKDSIVATDTDLVGGTLFLFGGKQGNVFENHLYSLNVKEHNTTDGDWSKVCPRGDTANKPEGRDGHSTTHAVGRIWVYGGWNEKAYLKDLWHITPRPAKTGSGLGGCPSTSNFEGEWKQEGAEGSALHLDWPPALNSHSMVAYGGFLYLFGGFSHDVSKVGAWTQCDEDDAGCKYYNQMWSFDVNKMIWRDIVANNKEGETGLAAVPPARARHAAAVVNGGMIVFGGVTAVGKAGDTWRFDMKAQIWDKMDVSEDDPKISFGNTFHPGPRSEMQAVAIGDQFFMYGGDNGSGPLNDLWVYETDTTQCLEKKIEANLTAWLVVFILLFVGATGFICYQNCRGGGNDARSGGYSSGSAGAELGGTKPSGNYQAQS